MDVSIDTSSSEEESLDIRVARLAQSSQHRLEAALQADPDWDKPQSPPPYIPSPTHQLSLRFPSPTHKTPIFSFEAEHFSEDLEASSQTSDSQLVSLRQELENALMRVEDLTSFLCNNAGRQTVILSPFDLRTLKQSLDSFTPGDSLELSLGALRFTVEAPDASAQLADQYAQILEEAEEVYETAPDMQETDLAACSDQPAETEESMAARAAEIEAEWEKLAAQKHDLDLREESLQSLESKLQSQAEDLSRARCEFETSISAHSQRVQTLNAHLSTLRADVETVIREQIEANLAMRKEYEDSAVVARREQYEREFRPLKDAAYAYIAGGFKAEELESCIDLAEKEFVAAIASGKATKYKAKLSSLTAKLMNIKMQEAMAQQAHRTQSITSTIDALSSPKGLGKSRSLQRNAGRESALRRNLQDTRSVMSHTTCSELEGPKSPSERSFDMGHSFADTMSFRTFNCGSPSFESEDQSSNEALSALLRLAESSADRWRCLSFSLLSRLRASEHREAEQQLVHSRLLAWQKRLAAVEQSLSTRESHVSERESKVSAREDLLLVRLGKHLSPADAQKMAEVSYAELCLERKALEDLRGDLMSSSQHLETQGSAIAERKRALEQEVRDLKSYRERLSACAKASDSILERFARCLPRLK